MTEAPLAEDEQPNPTYRVIGAVLWCLCLQFFVVEQIVRHGWTTPYSWADNYISDLGVTVCANRPPDSLRFVCSPLHGAMNASFVVQGVLIAGGAVLNRTAFPAGHLQTVALYLLGLAGAGVIAVGFAPVDVHVAAHYAGAGIHFVTGNLGMILLGTSILQQSTSNRRLPRSLGIGPVLAGAVGILALLLLASGQYGAIGAGTIERLVAYPLPLVLAAIGGVLFFKVRSGR